MKTYILTGPQRCGKTTHSAQIAKNLGCRTIVDDWDPGKPMTRGALHITYWPFSVFRSDDRISREMARCNTQIINYSTLPFPDLRSLKRGPDDD